jgi:adenylate cyclase
VRGLSPEEVLELLEQALGRVADVIAMHKGTLLEFIGDEVLAVFNAPNQIKAHCYAGVVSALEIHEAISKMPVHKAANGSEIAIKCRCGVNTCSILAGNIGSSQRMKYGLLGDGINLTARLKGINSRYKTPTLCSDKAYADERTQRAVFFRPVDLVAVKGKKDPTAVYEPLAKKEAGSEKTLQEEVGEKHSEAFKLYKARDFAAAQKLFEEVRLKYASVDREDEPSKMLSARCLRYIDDPPAVDWDGVERLTKK